MSAFVTIIIKVVQKAKAPEHSQDERINALEKKVERFEQLFDNDNKRLIELEKGNRITQQALLALLSHAINGDDIDSLRKAKTKMENLFALVMMLLALMKPYQMEPRVVEIN